MRYGLHQKPIQNPYGHQKTAYFKIQQATISNDMKTPTSLDIQGLRGNKIQQLTTRENSPYIIGKDEVGSSNLPSSSMETRCPARDSGFLLFSVGKFAYAKPIQKPIPIKFDGIQSGKVFVFGEKTVSTPPGYPGKENLWTAVFRLTVGEEMWDFDFFRCSF